MNASFNVAENGGGSYRLLAILRWVMVVIFVSFGMQKFTLQSAQGIVQFTSNSPFVSWLSLFGFRGEAYFLGAVEFAIAALLAAGAFSPILSAVGSLMSVVTFAITWSFFFTTPGVVEWSLSTNPNCLEFDWRVSIQGYRLALRLCRVVPGLFAAISCPITDCLELPFLDFYNAARLRTARTKVWNLRERTSEAGIGPKNVTREGGKCRGYNNDADCP